MTTNTNTIPAHLTITSNDPDLQTSIWWIENDMSPAAALEEALYVLWELTANEYGWERELSKTRETMFNYHHLGESKVIRHSDLEYEVIHYDC